MDEKKYGVYHNSRCGTDPITSPPITSGKTALDALTNAWKIWSIPPVIIENALYYVPDVNINMILREVEV